MFVVTVEIMMMFVHQCRGFTRGQRADWPVVNAILLAWFEESFTLLEFQFR